MKKTMSPSMNQTFDPFSRHRDKTESPPKPVQVRPTAEATAEPVEANKSVSMTATTATEENPPTKPARTGRAFDPFDRHAGEKKPKSQPRLGRAHWAAGPTRPLAEREQQIAELEREIDRLQRTEEAIVVATGAPREAGCPE
jgi:hypothetical protein